MLKRFISPGLVISVIALVFAAGGTAWATGALNGHNLLNNSVTHNKLSSNVVWHGNLGSKVVQCGNLSASLQHVCSLKSEVGPQGPQGPKGDTGATGPQGPTGASGFNGAFYSRQTYTEAVGVGAIATAACDPKDATRSQQYAAISGGVQDTNDTTDMTANSNQLAVAASFPGRMDWNTNTPLPNRLDGWIVQFAHVGQQDTNLVVWALCIPVADDGGNVPVVTN